LAERDKAAGPIYAYEWRAHSVCWHADKSSGLCASARYRRLSEFSYAIVLREGASCAIRAVVENNSIEINVRFGFAAAAADTRNSDFPAPRFV